MVFCELRPMVRTMVHGFLRLRPMGQPKVHEFLRQVYIIIFELMKFNLDAFYFGELQSENVLVHVDPAVIKAMAAFIFIAILKDILVGAYIYALYEGTGIIKNYLNRNCL